ncbi:hypothetical protein NHQ30_004536 [Ciborinia camelliae]|nr:hypothetical protein NHQ30_004536 [Ciborinia camelliae]
MPHSTPAMQAPPIPYSTKPHSLMSLPSLKEYMVARLVAAGTHVLTTDDALRDYERHRNKMEELCNGATKTTITFLADKLFWRAHWPHEPYPRDSCYLTPNDMDVIHTACAKLSAGTIRAGDEETRRREVKRSRDLYSREAWAWSKAIGEKLARMPRNEKWAGAQNVEDIEERLDLEAFSQLEI